MNLVMTQAPQPARPKAAVSAREWLAWAALTWLCLAALWAVIQSPPSIGGGIVRAFLFVVVVPALSVAALALPVCALIALLTRRFHMTLLAGMGVVAALLLAYAGLEAYWASLPAQPLNWPPPAN